MDKNNLSDIINSKAVTYIVLTVCVIVTAKFVSNFAKDAGILPSHKS